MTPEKLAHKLSQNLLLHGVEAQFKVENTWMPHWVYHAANYYLGMEYKYRITKKIDIIKCIENSIIIYYNAPHLIVWVNTVDFCLEHIIKKYEYENTKYFPTVYKIPIRKDKIKYLNFFTELYIEIQKCIRLKNLV